MAGQTVAGLWQHKTWTLGSEQALGLKLVSDVLKVICPDAWGRGWCWGPSAQKLNVVSKDPQMAMRLKAHTHDSPCGLLFKACIPQSVSTAAKKNRAVRSEQEQQRRPLQVPGRISADQCSWYLSCVPVKDRPGRESMQELQTGLPAA